MTAEMVAIFLRGIHVYRSGNDVAVHVSAKVGERRLLYPILDVIAPSSWLNR